jgi:hypothetical protein
LQSAGFYEACTCRVTTSRMSSVDWLTLLRLCVCLSNLTRPAVAQRDLVPLSAVRARMSLQRVRRSVVRLMSRDTGTRRQHYHCRNPWSFDYMYSEHDCQPTDRFNENDMRSPSPALDRVLFVALSGIPLLSRTRQFDLRWCGCERFPPGSFQRAV